MDVPVRAQHVAGIAKLLVRDPAQLRHVPRWLGTRRKSTLSLEMPWLAFNVMELLDDALTPDSKVFEFGGGGSTVWFAPRAAEVVTVEHDDGWFRSLSTAVGDLPNCTVLHGSRADGAHGYVGAIADYPDGHFDVVVVDGRDRLRCLQASMSKVRRGGLLLLDDAERERYAPAFPLMAGWSLRTVRGLAPTKPVPGTTAVWTRP